jgi:hypothetical protein
MSPASQRTIEAIEEVVKDVPIGTNLGLLRLLWAMVSGAFLHSRGGVFPALQWAGFSEEESRHSWQALRYGVWQMNDLIAHWRHYVLSHPAWQPHTYEGYRPLAVDLTTFWRPRLQGWLGRFFHRVANRLMKGVAVGVVVEVGQVGSQRVPLLKRLLRPSQPHLSQDDFQKEILQAVAQQLDRRAVLVHDGGVSLRAVQEAGVARFVVRLPLNCTARRNQLPARQPRGRPPEYGRRVRPLPRIYQEQRIAATPPDFEGTFPFAGRTIQVQGWQDLVRPDQKVAAAAATFQILVFHNPLYDTPLVVGTNVRAQPRSIFCLYLDRWPVEQLPLAAKQMLGLQRQFVFAPTTCWRLPALALLAGNILTYLAAVLPPLATGFWDRAPKRTPGRLRRVLAQSAFPETYPFDPRLRKKGSLCAHLPKGIDAHRRQKAA